MQKLIIKGKKKLSGTISISGSKNATLPILAATILAGNVTLTNVPLVKDIFTMLDLLKFIGIKIKINKLRRSIELTGEGFSHPDLKYAASAANPTTAFSARTDYAFQSYFLIVFCLIFYRS